MAETALNKRICAAIRRLDPVRVENVVQAGTPDINCTVGWIECKQLRRWPSKGGLVRCEHFTPQQRVWLEKRAAARGRCWLVAQVGRTYLLFEGDTAAKVFGHSSEATLRSKAIGVWDGKLKDEEFEACLSRST